MADRQSSVDVRTLEAVQQLLATTEFASIDDVARRAGDPAQLRDALERINGGTAASSPVTALDAAGIAPLPRRR